MAPFCNTKVIVKIAPGGLTKVKFEYGDVASLDGAGLRPMECLWLRVQDIDFGRSEILVRDGKGAKDRITMLPESPKKPLQDHLRKVKPMHERDLAEGWGRVQLPGALERKDVSTTMIYAHVLNKGGHGVRSPADTVTGLYSLYKPERHAGTKGCTCLKRQALDE